MANDGIWRALAAAVCSAMLLAGFAGSARADDLLSLYQAALNGNPQLRGVQLGTEQARADADVARSRLYPQLSIQATASRNDYRDEVAARRFSGNRTIFSARQALIDLPSVYRVRGAGAIVLKSERDAEQARAELFAQLVDQYLKALQAQDDLAQMLAEKDAARRQVDRLRAMRKREMAKITDLAEAIAWEQQLATREIDAVNQSAAARVRLRELTGRATGELAVLTRSEFPPVPQTEDYWVEAVLAQNMVLASRSASVEANRLAADAARAEHLPQLSLSLQRNQSNQDIDNSPRRDFSVDSIALELRIPIYEGGRVNSSTASAMARLAISNEALEATRREIERETRLLYASAGANRARIDSTNAEVEALTHTVRAAERGLELGVVTVIQVLDARRRLLRSRADQAKARYDYLRDLIGLRVRAGGLSEADLQDFNGWLGAQPEVPAGLQVMPMPELQSSAGGALQHR